MAANNTNCNRYKNLQCLTSAKKARFPEMRCVFASALLLTFISISENSPAPKVIGNPQTLTEQNLAHEDPDPEDDSKEGNVQRINDPEDVGVFKPRNNNEGRFLLSSGKIADVTLLPGGDSGVSGSLTISQHWTGFVIITGTISGLTNGFHGFHIHEKGDVGADCTAAGGHFNPDGVTHGSPVSLTRHAGDLGNIFAFYGTANPYIWDRKMSLGDGGNRDIAGRAVVVHAGVDDLGKGMGDSMEGSLAHGNAGARVACGIITLRT